MESEMIMKKLEELQRTVIESKEEILHELANRALKLEEKTKREINKLRSKSEQLKHELTK